MKKILPLVLLLCACSQKTVYSSVAENAKATVKNLTTILPEECKTQEVFDYVVQVNSSIDTVVESCDLEIKPLEMKITSLKAIIFALSVALASLLVGILRKRL